MWARRRGCSTSTSSISSRRCRRQHRPRRRRAGPGPPRRGLPRSRVLGRALHLPVPQPARSRAHPGAPPLSVPPPRRRRDGQRWPRPATPGRMYPWQSGSDGREETQTTPSQPESGRWLPDASHLQRHIGATDRPTTSGTYWQVTGDMRVHAVLRRRDDARDRAVLVEHRRLRPRARPIRDQGVMGPDEYHDGYPTGRARASTTTPTRT